MDGDDDNEEDPYGFPIQEIDINVDMKNIPPCVLPNFKGIRSEDPKTFFFFLIWNNFSILWLLITHSKIEFVSGIIEG